MGAAVSSSHAVSAAPSSSGRGLLTLCPCSSMKSLSRETVLHKLLQQFGCSSSRTAPAWVLPTGCSPSGTESPTGSQALPAKLLQRGLLSPRVRRSWQEPAPAWAPHGATASFRHPPAPAWGPFHGLQVDICSTMDLHGLQRDNLPHHGLQHELQGKTLCSGISSTSSCSFFTDLGVCRVVSLTSSHSSFFSAISPQFISSPS